MGWSSAIKKTKTAVAVAIRSLTLPSFPLFPVEWSKLVTLDFETYWDTEYTLKKMSTSEYVRDPRFKAQMVGIKIGNKPTKAYGAKKIKAALAKIDWSTHSLLCHNTAFDGFILSHRYGIVPKMYYCTLSMARGLHSNEIGAGLDEVAKFYGGEGKIEGVLELTKGVVDWPAALEAKASVYCAQDNDECYRIFRAMQPKFPADEMELVDLTIRMFCDPVLKVDIPRVQKELESELAERQRTFYAAVNPADWDKDPIIKTVLKTKAERELTGVERGMLIIKRVLGSNDKFAALLRAEGVEPPVKISDAWIKKPKDQRNDEDKWTFAFAKDDLDFVNLPDMVETWCGKLSQNKKADVPKIAAKQQRLRELVDSRIAVKSTTNITRAQRFLTAGANGMPLPCGYSYYRAHTGRWGGNNKMNMQNLKRGGELRLSIVAPRHHQIVVVDSGQIEARVNAWLWGQDDLLDAFRVADAYEAEQAKLPEDQRKQATGNNRDAYCRFGDDVYGFEVLKSNKMERFVGKVCVLGLGFQMGAPKFQMTLAKGALGGPPVFFALDECKRIVNTYRMRNSKIRDGWTMCTRIIEDMAAGREGTYKCISWEKETIWLPNGMSLKYPDLRKALNEDKGWEEWSYQSGDMRSKIYGGLLCENLVQALARIIVGWQMLQISRKDRVVMTTHDEVVTCVKNARAPAAFNHMHKWMSTAPAWCPDIPLNCEGGWAENYSK